ncbi:MAG: threonylcarbamoyl-AMP synthase [Candidatus Omnitrophica bacterium]|nr:threonylcarbamoyl-AMP synthase [Candidatus Omnitrophota bacterium]
MKTEIIQVNPDFPDLDVMSRCGKIIRQGGLIVFPTETVYGIAADFNNPKAMQRLRGVKKRADHKPFSILISQKFLLSNYSPTTDPKIYKIIDQFWPGPLTVIVPSKEEEKSIGLRMPDHEIALKIVEESRCTIAAPSANFEGDVPPVTCQQAMRKLDGLVDLAIDGGEASVGQGSTIVNLTGDELSILREGSISKGELEETANTKTILFVCTGNSCRSVMAEYLLKDMVKNRGDLEIVSAGTSVFLQAQASGDTISVLKEKGVDATRHYSQPLNPVLLKKSDLIFVMTRMHRQQILDRVPSVEKRVYLLREFANIPANWTGDVDIPDPMGKNHAAYKDCVNVIQEALYKVVELI